MKGLWRKGTNIIKDRWGMSLVEIMIVIALMGILSASAVSLMGRIYYANTKKTVEIISTALDKLRITAMSTEGTNYLYIYQIGEECYLTESDVKCDAFDDSVMTEKGTKLCGGSTDIFFIDSGTETKVDSVSQAVIRVVYTKSGAFGLDTNAEKIVIKGQGETTISLKKDTGKHYID